MSSNSVQGVMVILREGICPGINEDFIKALQSEDIRTGVDFEYHTDTCSFKLILMALKRNTIVLTMAYGVKPTTTVISQ